MAWQKKYSIPAACLAFMLVALGLGVSNRRDGRLASFVVGIGVVFVYWVLMYMAEAIAKGGLLPYWFAWVAMWVPNVGRRRVGRVADREEAARARAVDSVRAAVPETRSARRRRARRRPAARRPSEERASSWSSRSRTSRFRSRAFSTGTS